MVENPIHDSDIDIEEGSNHVKVADVTLYSVPLDSSEVIYDSGDASSDQPTDNQGPEWDERVYSLAQGAHPAYEIPVAADGYCAPRVAWPANVYEGQYEEPCTASDYIAVAAPSYAENRQGFFNPQRSVSNGSGQGELNTLGGEYDYGFKLSTSNL